MHKSIVTSLCLNAHAVNRDLENRRFRSGLRPESGEQSLPSGSSSHSAREPEPEPGEREHELAHRPAAAHSRLGPASGERELAPWPLGLTFSELVEKLRRSMSMTSLLPEFNQGLENVSLPIDPKQLTFGFDQSLGT